VLLHDGVFKGPLEALSLLVEPYEEVYLALRFILARVLVRNIDDLRDRASVHGLHESGKRALKIGGSRAQDAAILRQALER